MKKIFVVSSVVILLGALVAAGYWYLQSDKITDGESLQTVTLDNPTIVSFDDVCTKEDNGQLNCTGNIAEFGCTSYGDIADSTIGLRPAYSVISCLKENHSSSTGGVYQLRGTAYVDPRDVDYVIIKDGVFQLIQSVEELRHIYQPIKSIDEAKAYFSVLGKGVLVFDQDMLSRITSPQVFHSFLTNAKFDVPIDSIGLSQVTEAADGYILTPYSAIPGFCIDEVYWYTFLLQRDGQLIEQNKKLIWTTEGKSNCYE